MEIQQLASEQGEIYSPLHDIFEQAMGRMPDLMRNHDLLDQWLFHDGGATRLFLVEDTPSVLVLSNILEGLSADVMLLNPDEAEAMQIYRELLTVMEAWQLKRLTSQVPGPVKDVQRVLKEVGFRREGHLRRATYWNGRLCGIDVYGLYKDRPKANRGAGRNASGSPPDSAPRSSESTPARAEIEPQVASAPAEPAPLNEPPPHQD